MWVVQCKFKFEVYFSPNQYEIQIIGNLMKQLHTASAIQQLIYQNQ